MQQVTREEKQVSEHTDKAALQATLGFTRWTQHFAQNTGFYYIMHFKQHNPIKGILN